MIRMGQNDTGPLDVILRRRGQAVLETGDDCTITIKKQVGGSPRIEADCLVVDVEDRDGTMKKGARWEPATDDLDTPGLYYVQWLVTKSSGEQFTVPPGRAYETLEVGTAL